MESLYSKAYTPDYNPRKYFAFVESVENEEVKGEFKLFVRFDCLMIEEGKRIAEISDISLEQLEKTPFITIETFEPISKWEIYFNSDIKLSKFENSWIIIETRFPVNEGITANEFYNGAEGQSKHHLFYLKPTAYETKILNGLNKLFDISNFPISTSLQIQKKLNNINIDLVCVVNVGQGNLNALIGHNMALAYFDLGGGTMVNQSTYLNTVRTCRRSKYPVVILSHWDMDHVETALRDTSNCDLIWIVPQQKVGKTHYTLALRITNVGTLLVWPNNLNSIVINTLEIIKCNGIKRNDSGLSVVVNANTLLPADCAYKFIPNIATYKLTCLVASHHGSNTGQFNVPLALNKGWIAYSYGQNNNWGHPTTNACNSHANMGWILRNDTTSGNIVFHQVNYITPCGGACDLRTVQHF